MIRRLLFSEASPNLGGQELQLLAQMSALLERGIDVRLLCRANSRIAEAARAGKFTTLAVPFRNSLHPPSIAAIVRVLNEWQPDAVISHSGHDANACAIAARLARRRPRLIRVRTYQAGPASAWAHNYLTDLTLTCSEALRQSLLNNPRIHPKRIQVLYPGIDFDQLGADSLAPLPPDLQARLSALPPRRLLHVAMLRPEKGHLLMLDALASLHQSFPDLAYVVAGDGAMRGALEARIAKLGLQERVALLGRVEKVSTLMRQAEILVMPSSYEPLGMSQVEALALGTAVVASRTGGIPETLDDHRHGLLVAPGDAAAWSSALAWALDHPAAMRTMAAAGRDVVRDRFSLARSVDALLAFAADESHTIAP